MSRTPEGITKEAIKKLFHAEGLIRAGSTENHWPPQPKGWYYMPVPSALGIHGIADFVGFRNVVITPEMVGSTVAEFLYVEAKAKGKKSTTSPNQDRRSAEIEAANGVAVVVDDVEQLKEVFHVPHT